MITEESSPLVSIVILNYNAGDLLLDCVESILKTNYNNYEIILVDNTSKDQSHKKCKEKFEQIILIENDKNLGYCEGNNVGIREAKGEYVVILNPDTVVDPNWLNELINSFKIHGEGLYQPKFLATTNPKMLLSSGNMIQLFGFGYSRSKGDLDKNQFYNHEIIGYASGTCLFTSTKIMMKLEMFDPFLFAFHDDLDLGWRAAHIGIKSYYVPKSIVYHPIEGYSFQWSPFKFYLMERNRLYCLLTHYSRKTLYPMLPALVIIEIAVFFFYLKKGLVKEKFKASINILKNFNKINQRYKKLENEKIVSDKEIIKNFTDDISVPEWVLKKESSKLLNNFIKQLSKFTRKFI